MYGLDINFLSDRSQRPIEAGLKPMGQVQSDPKPYYIGAAVAVALVGLTGGAWIMLKSQNADLEARKATLDGQLEVLKTQLSQIQSFTQQVEQIESQNQALATVFDQIKPWSAVMQDVRDRVPNGIQIDTIEQVAPPENAAAAAPTSPSPTDGSSPAPEAIVPPADIPTPLITISGKARSFNDVNDFLLTLQRSPFLKGEEVKLVSSTLIDNPTQVEFSSQPASGGEIKVQLPQVVEYKIEGSFTDLTASELLQDLERTLSVGLATRIQALRDRGVLKP
jgi:type IV pilus assembly protein PilN